MRAVVGVGLRAIRVIAVVRRNIGVGFGMPIFWLFWDVSEFVDERDLVLREFDVSLCRLF